MSHSGKPKLSRTTPFPNELIDDVMPYLNDTQWRVLCVIVRQTLGWHDRRTGSRKIRDWLSQSQLKARTGRNAEALAAANDALVGQSYIVVEDEAGHPLDSPGKRRAYRGRSYYRLADAWLQRVGLPVLQERNRNLIHATNSIFPSETRKTEFVNTGKSNRTKETQTKEKLTKRTQFQKGAADSQMAKADFYAAFAKLANQYGRDTGHAILTAREKEQLQYWLSVTPQDIWKPLLVKYFESEIPYVIRHGYSLRAFFNVRHLLQLQKNR